MSIFSKYCS